MTVVLLHNSSDSEILSRRTPDQLFGRKQVFVCPGIVATSLRKPYIHVNTLMLNVNVSALDVLLELLISQRTWRANAESCEGVSMLE